MTDVPVKLRAEIVAQRAYKQGKPAPVGAFKLSSNEVHFPPLESVQRAVTESVITNRYPDASAGAVREALAEHYGVSTENIIVGAGSVALLYQAIQAAASVGDEVMFPWRSFEAYPGMATLAGATEVHVPLHRDGSIDLDAMLDAITDRTRIIIVCTPNNPTGPAVGQREFEQFMEKVPNDLLVVADEAYIEFVTDPNALNATRIIADYPNLVIARTFSKAYGLAGMRIGYMIGHPGILNAFNTTAIPFLIPGQAQAAALAVMREPEAIRQRVNEITARRDEVRRALLDQGWPVPEAQANFVWLPCGEQTDGVAAILAEGGIIARAFSGDGIRISIAEEEAVTPLLAACWRAIERYPYLRAEEGQTN